MKKKDHMPEAGRCSRISLGMVMLVVLMMSVFADFYSPDQADAAVVIAPEGWSSAFGTGRYNP